jgi:hypothetical protein
MNYRYCKYCITELRGSYYRAIGVCNYCDKNPKRRRIYTRIEKVECPVIQDINRLKKPEKSIEELKAEAEKFKAELDRKIENLKQEMRKLLEP